jgi:hypothetical protein
MGTGRVVRICLLRRGRERCSLEFWKNGPREKLFSVGVETVCLSREVNRMFCYIRTTLQDW